MNCHADDANNTLNNIPNIIHFICISPMRFELYHYIAIKSAYKMHKPDIIYVYVDVEPRNNFYWECIKKYITIEIIIPPKKFRGRSIPYPQYQADIIRLEKLIERGGIYLDIDNFSLKPFTDLINNPNNKLIMGASPYKGLSVVEKLQDVDAISNSIIMTIPNHPLLTKWYEEMDQYMDDKIKWAYHAVCLPRDIINRNKELANIVTILDWHTYFCPFDWEQYPYIFDENFNHMMYKLDNFYTIVFYQTMVYDTYLKNLNIHFFKNNNNIFTQLFKKYVKFPINKLDQLYDMLWALYKGGDWKILDEYATLYNDMYSTHKNNININSLFLLSYAQYQLEKYTECRQNCEIIIKSNNIEDNIKNMAKYFLEKCNVIS